MAPMTGPRVKADTGDFLKRLSAHPAEVSAFNISDTFEIQRTLNDKARRRQRSEMELPTILMTAAYKIDFVSSIELYEIFFIKNHSTFKCAGIGRSRTNFPPEKIIKYSDSELPEMY